MRFNVLKHYHPMIGIPYLEMHQAIFPPPVPPVPKLLHFAAAMLCKGPWGKLTGKPNKTEISASGGMMMSQGTDIGPLIPHVGLPFVPPNVLLAVIIPTSGSKSHFGAHSHVAPEGPIAFACAKVINFNLNCAGPAWPPLPAGVVLAFNTHTVGVTVGDLVAGALHMFIDGLIQFGLNRLFSSKQVVDKFFESLAQRALGPVLKLCGGASVEYVVGRVLGDGVGRAAEEFLFSLPGYIIGLLVGSPLGYSPEHSGLGNKPVEKGVNAAHERVQQAVDNYFNSQSVDQHPAQPPASAQPSASTPPPASAPPPAAGQPSASPPAPGSAQPPASGQPSASSPPPSSPRPPSKPPPSSPRPPSKPPPSSSGPPSKPPPASAPKPPNPPKAPSK